MKVQRALKIRIYPNETQKVLLLKTFGCCRFIYNAMLSERKEVYEKLKNDKRTLYEYDYKTEKGFNTFLRENGLNPERYSHGDSGSSNNSGGCFLTTACTAARGLPDDCYELETLRGFRDNWLKKRKGGGTPIQEYYEIAPRIVEKINALPDADEIWERIYCELVVPCVELIDEGEYDAAFKHYQDYTLRLKERYLTDKASAE